MFLDFRNQKGPIAHGKFVRRNVTKTIINFCFELTNLHLTDTNTVVRNLTVSSITRETHQQDCESGLSSQHSRVNNGAKTEETTIAVSLGLFAVKTSAGRMAQ